MDQLYDQIEAYVNGELEPPERDIFEMALKKDLQLQEAVARHREVVEELAAMRLRRKIKANLQPPPQLAGRANNPKRRWWMVALAFMLTVSAVYVWYTAQSTAEILPPPAQPPSNGQPMAVDPSDPNDDLGPSTHTPLPKTPSPPQSPAQLTTDPKIRQAYAAVAHHLENVDFAVMGDTQKDADTEQKLNQAIAFLKSERPGAAIPLLETVLSRNNPLYQEDGEWLLSLAWLLIDPAKSKMRLKTISQNPAHTYRTDAMRLLSQLE